MALACGIPALVHTRATQQRAAALHPPLRTAEERSVLSAAEMDFRRRGHRLTWKTAPVARRPGARSWNARWRS